MMTLNHPRDTRVCPVCTREFIPADTDTLVCTAYECRIHGRVDITVPQGLFPKLEHWEFIQHPKGYPERAAYPIPYVQSIRIAHNAPVIVITNLYDSSEGFVYEGTYVPQDRAFIIAEFRILEDNPNAHPFKPMKGATYCFTCSQEPDHYYHSGGKKKT